MSGELVARLRRVAEVTERHDQAKAEPKLLREAADRIEELEREVASRISIEEHAAADHEAAYAGAAALVRIERMEAVVAAARGVVLSDALTRTAHADYCPPAAPPNGRGGPCWCGARDRIDAAQGLRDALAALDATSGTSPDTQSSAPNLVQRPCPNAVSFCGGPDRYGDTCKACLVTWTEEKRAEVRK